MWKKRCEKFWAYKTWVKLKDVEPSSLKADTWSTMKKYEQVQVHEFRLPSELKNSDR